VLRILTISAACASVNVPMFGSPLGVSGGFSGVVSGSRGAAFGTVGDDLTGGLTGAASVELDAAGNGFGVGDCSIGESLGEAPERCSPSCEASRLPIMITITQNRIVIPRATPYNLDLGVFIIAPPMEVRRKRIMPATRLATQPPE
jgi:hypothetical protein